MKPWQHVGWGVVGSCIGVVILMNVLPIEVRKKERLAVLERACVLAAGNARTTASWLAPGHSRRDAALLLLTRDAAWAPVCAKDPRAGELLRDQILAATSEPEPMNARILAESLVEILEQR